MVLGASYENEVVINSYIMDFDSIGYKQVSNTIFHELEHAMQYKQAKGDDSFIISNINFSNLDIDTSSIYSSESAYPYEFLNYLISAKVTLEGTPYDFDLPTEVLKRFEVTKTVSNQSSEQRYKSIKKLMEANTNTYEKTTEMELQQGYNNFSNTSSEAHFSLGSNNDSTYIRNKISDEVENLRDLEQNYSKYHKNKTPLLGMNNEEKFKKLEKLDGYFQQINQYQYFNQLLEQDNSNLNAQKELKSRDIRSIKLAELNKRFEKATNKDEVKLINKKIDYWDDTYNNLQKKIVKDYGLILSNTKFSNDYLANEIVINDLAFKNTVYLRKVQANSWKQAEKGIQYSYELSKRRKKILEEFFNVYKKEAGLRKANVVLEFDSNAFIGKDKDKAGKVIGNKVIFNTSVLTDTNYELAIATIAHEVNHLRQNRDLDEELLKDNEMGIFGFSQSDILKHDTYKDNFTFVTPVEVLPYAIEGMYAAESFGAKKLNIKGSSYNTKNEYLNDYGNLNVLDIIDEQYNLEEYGDRDKIQLEIDEYKNLTADSELNFVKRKERPSFIISTFKSYDAFNKEELEYYSYHKNKMFLADMDNEKKLKKVIKIKVRLKELKGYKNIKQNSSDVLANKYLDTTYYAKHNKELKNRLSLATDENEKQLLENKTKYWDDSVENVIDKLKYDFLVIGRKSSFSDINVANGLFNINEAIEKTRAFRTNQAVQWAKSGNNAHSKQVREEIIKDLYIKTASLYGVDKYVEKTPDIIDMKKK